MSYVELVEVIAKNTGMTRAQVRIVLDALPSVIIERVLDGEDVKFKNFGRFTRRVYKAKRSFYGSAQGNVSVKFVPSELAKVRTGMEKLGVELDESKVKTSSTTNRCPKCGGDLPSETYCNKCGTEPFEKRPEKK